MNCTWEEFKQRAKEFREAAPSLNLEELQNAWKCISLSYFQLTEPQWNISAAILLELLSKTFIECEGKLK